MLRLAVLSAPRQALVRGRGGSRLAARGHRGSQVLRRARHVTSLVPDSLKAAGFSKNPSESGAHNPHSFKPAQPPSHSFTASLKARCALSEGSEAQPGQHRFGLWRGPAALSSTPCTAHSITRRLKLSSKAQIYVAFARPKAACSADLAITSYLLWQLVCSQWLCTRSALANAKRQPCCRTQERTCLAAHPRAERHNKIRGGRARTSQLHTPETHSKSAAPAGTRWPSRSLH